MPALQGYEEATAAQLVADFMKELAKQLEIGHSVAGFWKRYRFRGKYDTSSLLEKEDDDEPSLTGRFIIEVRSRRLAREVRRTRPFGWLYKSRDWLPFAHFSLHRIDWDDTPEMQGGICLLYHPELVTDSFKSEVRHFMKVTFGSDCISYFDAAGVREALMVPSETDDALDIINTINKDAKL